MEIIYGSQGDETWKQNRLGSVGGSGIKRLMSKGKGKTRATFLYELAAEILTGVKYEGYTSQAMLDGLEKEEAALNDFSYITEFELERVSLIKGDTPRTHCSPDSLIPSIQSGVEVKAPFAHTHIKYVDENRLPLEYVLQVQYSMWITGYEYWYFFSYFPGIKPLLLKVKRDEKLIKEIEAATMVFLKELDELVEKMR